MSSEKCSPLQTSTKAKNNVRTKSFSSFSDGFLMAGGALTALTAVWALWCFLNPNPINPGFFSTAIFSGEKAVKQLGPDPHPTCHVPGPNLDHDPPEKNFYDDPKLSYSIDGPPVKNWDEKRRDWLNQHPSFAPGAEDRILMVTGSQSAPCKNPVGDHLLLRFYKNKADYARRHNIDIFYNTVLFQPKMFFFWAKIPTVRAAMVAHPEAEWIWWVDSDAAFTDMDFKLPLGRYKAHNMVINGWPNLIYEKKSWTGINAGVFLIRNCQWAMDLMDVWARMGPQAHDYEKWGEIQRTIFKDKLFAESDDQSGLIYLLLKEKEKWGNKIYVESEYYFQGYWLDIVGKFDNITEKYVEIERKVLELRRRHAEKASGSYGRVWEDHLKDAGYGLNGWRRPFITHFTGCEPCSGDHNEMYSEQTCFDAMQKALLFADNQVLRHYGFVHRDLGDPATVEPLPFD